MNIPILGKTAQEVLKNALNYETAGFLLKFQIVGEGEWLWSQINNRFEKIRYPITERIEGSTFDGWLLNQISKGFCSIFVQSPGKNPHYSKEIHRATARQIPLD